LESGEAKRLRPLEDANRKLKHVVAELTLDNRARKAARDGELRTRLKELAGQRMRFGYRRLRAMLEREGMPANHKRVYRLYREEGLAMRIATSRVCTNGNRGEGMRKAITKREPEQGAQTPSPAPDLIPCSNPTSTENSHSFWYSKWGHFNSSDRRSAIYSPALGLFCYFLSRTMRPFKG
jgi:hypothetical protein